MPQNRLGVPLLGVAMLCMGAMPCWGEGTAPSGQEMLLFQEIPVVIASKTQQKISEAPSIVSVITEHDIQASGARNLEDLLRTVAGFDAVAFPNFNDVHLVVRGSASNNNKIKFMLNGHSLRSFDGSPAFYLNAIPLANLRAIEIIRGPGSALYGENAFLGVINLLTKDNLPEGKTAKLSVAGGNFNTWRPEVELSGDAGGFKAYALADFYRSDGARLPVDSDKATLRYGPAYSAAPGETTSDFENLSFQSNLHYDRLYATGFYLRQRAGTPLGFNLALSPDNQVAVTTGFGELGYGQDFFAELLRLDVKTYADYFDYSPRYELWPAQTAARFSNAFPASRFPADEGMYGCPQGRLAVWGAEATVTGKIFPALQAVAGALYDFSRWYDIRHFANYDDIGAPLVVDGVTYAPNQYLGGMTDISENGNWSRPAYRNTTAVYGQAEWDLKNGLGLSPVGAALKLTAGVRYDQYDDIGSSTNPRLGLVYAPIEPMTFKLLYGSAFRAPSFRELYNINNPTFVGNPRLKPEKASTVEAQCLYDFSESWKASLNGFNTEITDNIQFVGLGVPYQNAGHMLSRGAEVEVRYHYAPQKSAYINATYQDTLNISHAVVTSGARSYTQDDFYVGNTPHLIANVGGEADVCPHTSVNVSVNYTGPRPRSGEKKIDASGNWVVADGRDPLAARFLANLTLTLAHFEAVPGLAFQASVYNALNMDQRDPEASASVANDIPRPGRTYLAKLSYLF